MGSPVLVPAGQQSNATSIAGRLKAAQADNGWSVMETSFAGRSGKVVRCLVVLPAKLLGRLGVA
jgi:hypothetical protein